MLLFSPCRLCFLRTFPFSRHNFQLTTAGVKCLSGGCKMTPYTTKVCIFLILWDHCLFVVCILLMRYGPSVTYVDNILHIHWWTASIKPSLIFRHAGKTFWGLSSFLRLFCTNRDPYTVPTKRLEIELQKLFSSMLL